MACFYIFEGGIIVPLRTIVSLLTPTFIANCSWVRSNRALSSLILVFIFIQYPFYYS